MDPVRDIYFRRFPSGDKTFWYFSFMSGNRLFNYPSCNRLIKYKILKWSTYGISALIFPSGDKTSMHFNHYNSSYIICVVSVDFFPAHQQHTSTCARNTLHQFSLLTFLLHARSHYNYISTQIKRYNPIVNIFFFSSDSGKHGCFPLSSIG